MKAYRTILKRTLGALLALIIAAAPCALAEPNLWNPLTPSPAYTADIRLYSVGRVGFIASDSYIYQKASQFSDKLAVEAGMPVMVVGTAGQFFCIENAAGGGAYIPMSDVSPLIPANVDPFETYDPDWSREECMLMLPRNMTLYQFSNPFSRTVNIPQETPCYVLGQYGDFYRVCNMDRSVYAFILPSDLTYHTMWAVGA